MKKRSKTEIMKKDVTDETWENWYKEIIEEIRIPNPANGAESFVLARTRQGTFLVIKSMAGSRSGVSATADLLLYPLYEALLKIFDELAVRIST